MFRMPDTRIYTWNIYACAEITTSPFLQEHGTNKFEVQDKFATSYDVVEEQLKSSTIG